MEKAKLENLVNVLMSFEDIVLETNKEDYNPMDVFESDFNADNLKEFTYRVDSPKLLNVRNDVAKTFRLTVMSQRLCVNKALYTESITEDLKTYVNDDGKAIERKISAITKNYFFINYYSIEDFKTLVSYFRNAYYEIVSNECIKKSIGLELKFSVAEKKKTSAKKSQGTKTSAKKKREKATK